MREAGVNDTSCVLCSAFGRTFVRVLQLSIPYDGCLEKVIDL